MLWNWYTIDSCFIASTWHVRSAGTFAVSCIGVVLLVMLLEFLRRSTKEFDRFLIARHHKALEKRKSATGPLVARASSSTSNHDGSKAAGPVDRTSGSVSRLDAVGAHHAQRSFWDILFFRKARIVGADGDEPYLPTLQEQAIRALLHMCQFAVAYFVML